MNDKVNRRHKLRKTTLFHNTNQPWNELKLNTSWVIGSLNYLYKASNANTLEEWEQFYFDSGEKRLLLLDDLNNQKRNILEDIHLPYQRKREVIQQLCSEEIKLNTLYGRTISDFDKIASFFHSELIDRNFKPTLSKSVLMDYVHIRVIDETYLGFERERQTISILRSKFPFLKLIEVSYEDDVAFAIDAEVYNGDRLICAIQVKSLSYMESKNGYIQSVKKMNTTKNKAYEKLHKVPVLYAFSDRFGKIHNDELFTVINTLSKDVA